MHAVEDCIRTHGRNFACCFIFPNSISQRIMFEKALEITQEATLPSEAYLSWKAFVERCIAKNKKKGERVADSITRYMFACYLLACQADSKKDRIFKTLIPSGSNIKVFANWIASILPELQPFLYIARCDDAELADLQTLAKLYDAFLKENNFYEPSWQKVSFEDLQCEDDEAVFDSSGQKKYIIIYPELIDDFARYAEELQNVKNVEFLHVPFCMSSFQEREKPLYEAENTRQELKYVASQIEELLDGGVSAKDIALSVVDMDALQAFIALEGRLKGIPMDFYVQTAVLDNKFCSVFKNLQEVYNTHYSFQALKKLFFNHAVPWKFVDKIEGFLQFGFEHGCSVSWQEGKRWHNVWEEAFAFATSESHSKVEEELSRFFQVLKKDIDAICQSSSFSHLASLIGEFLRSYVELSQIKEEHLGAISRCQDLLKRLECSELVLKKYADAASIGRYDFFISLVEKEMIHSQGAGKGVAVFPYGAAVSIPFKHHFIVNLNQQDASIVRGGCKFLREDKRDEMNMRDVDLTSKFITGYLEVENVQFSYSKKTYQKYALAHSFFDQVLPLSCLSSSSVPDAYSSSEYHYYDSLQKEECFYLERLSSTLSSVDIMSEIEHLGKIYKVQADGMKVAGCFQQRRSASLWQMSFHKRIPSLVSEIEHKVMRGDVVLISQSGLSDFFVKRCPIYFLFSRVLNFEGKTFDFGRVKSKVMTPLQIGIIYHDMLERVYKKIREVSSGRFFKECIKKRSHSSVLSYEEIAGEVLRELCVDKQYSPIEHIFIRSMQQQMQDVLNSVFAFDAEFFDGYEIFHLEQKFEFLSSPFLLYHGKIDRVMKRDDGFILLDYKSGSNLPTYDASKKELEDFQMPLYVLLLEKGKMVKKEEDDKVAFSPSNGEVKTSLFFKLLQGKIACVFESDDKVEVEARGKSEARLGAKMSREEFEKLFSCLQVAGDEFARRIRECDFVPDRNIWDTCTKCEYKHICRTTFFVKKQFIGS